jgi:hypothetical protein
VLQDLIKRFPLFRKSIRPPLAESNAMTVADAVGPPAFALGREFEPHAEKVGSRQGRAEGTRIDGEDLSRFVFRDQVRQFRSDVCAGDFGRRDLKSFRGIPPGRFAEGGRQL